MTKETKDKIKFIFFFLFYPICKLFEILRECKGTDFIDFTNDWAEYIIGVFFWACGVFMINLMAYGLIYQVFQIIIPIGAIFTIIFFIIILPYIMHKFINRK